MNNMNWILPKLKKKFFPQGDSVIKNKEKAKIEEEIRLMNGKYGISDFISYTEDNVPILSELGRELYKRKYEINFKLDEHKIKELNKSRSQIEENTVTLIKQSEEIRNDKDINSYKVTGYGLKDNFLNNFIILRAHEEIVWLLNDAYCVLGEYSYLTSANKIIWSILDNKHKSPDLVFDFGTNKIGVEVTNLEMPDIMMLKGGIDNCKLLNKKGELLPDIEEEMSISQFTKANSVIEGKRKKVDKWNTKCDKKFLVLLSNQIDGWKWEHAYKQLLQEHVDNIQSRFTDKKFDRILIA